MDGKVKIGLGVLALIPLVFVARRAAASAEEPQYEVVRKEKDFELRRYRPYIVADLEVESDFEQAGNTAFQTLAGFIFGENVSAEKIGMTAPVTQRAKGEKIGMTAPVTQGPGDDGRYVISFVMPARYSMSSVPRPRDQRIKLREVPGALIAARRYSGRWTEPLYRREEAKLLEALRASNLRPVAGPIWARYNDPFTPFFLRRNEVMVQVES